MSNNIVLSAGIRQNLLSLQNTASLQQTTQQRLATGKKVNSALDNAVNFFTAAALSARQWITIPIASSSSLHRTMTR